LYSTVRVSVLSVETKSFAQKQASARCKQRAWLACQVVQSK
jgi:hypothetical protein